MNELITIVEDEDDIRALVCAGLKKERFRVREFADGKGFLSSLRSEKPDLVVLDVMLPDTDGFAICRGMRADRALAAIPVIMLTARAEEADRVLGLELGADDYVVKPFSPKELAARVKAVLRRASPEAGRSRIEVADGLLIDIGHPWRPSCTDASWSSRRRSSASSISWPPASAGYSPGRRSSTTSGATKRTSPTGPWTCT